MQGIDHHGRVIFIGTFSKVLFPALRLGYMVVPPNLSESFIGANGITLKGPPTHLQAAVADFITEGHFARHIRRMRKIYKERQDVLLAAAREELDGLLDPVPSNAGLHLIGWLPEGIDDVVVSEAAALRGIEVMPLSQCYQHDPQQSGLLLGFASSPPEAIKKGISVLGDVLCEVTDA
ncbi:MAG: PLP-dependent aminotransferase family protein [Rhodospirillaceae bacterium]|nr:PLP-dependent aminotransferase family protein [Rhodospirillaceae bacterium]